MNIAERYEHWMGVESSYAFSKYGPAEQYPYVEAGVARGSFSYKISILNYLQRALKFSEALNAYGDDRIGLQVVQSLGKSAHNLVALEASARAYYSGSPIQVATGFDTFYALADRLNVTVPYDTDSIIKAQLRRRQLFDGLQIAQDGGDMAAFHELLQPEMQLAANHFASAAETYGWPEPGYPSGNITPWQP